jgi:hypothetical protein
MSCEGSGNPTKNLIPVFDPPTTSSGKDVEVLAGPGILVDNLSDTETWRHKVTRVDIIALTATLALIAKAAGVSKSSPILKGTIVDEVNLTWEYNKAVTVQTLTNNGGLSVPTLDEDTVAFTLATQEITTNVSFTLEGNDGEGHSGSIASDTKSITFGNYMWLGHGVSKLGSSVASLEAFIESLGTSTIKTSRSHTYFATGGTNEKHFIAYPKAWGLATFTKGIFSGGYVRLKNVAGLLVSDIGVGTEIDIEFTNSAGHTEAYYVFESLYDNQTDAVTPFIIS